MGRSAANRAFLVGLGGFLLMASGCTRTVSGSGNVTSTPVPVSTFSRLEMSNAFDVTVSFGDKENVTLRVDDNIAVTWTWACRTGPCTSWDRYGERAVAYGAERGREARQRDRLTLTRRSPGSA